MEAQIGIIKFKDHIPIKYSITIDLTTEEIERLKAARVHFNPPSWTENAITELLDTLLSEIKNKG